jgi:hypothetical protein
MAQCIRKILDSILVAHWLGESSGTVEDACNNPTGVPCSDPDNRPTFLVHRFKSYCFAPTFEFVCSGASFPAGFSARSVVVWVLRRVLLVVAALAALANA